MRQPTWLAAVALLACAAPEERAEQARKAIQQALEQRDRPAALEAIDELRASLPDTPDTLLEVARLLVRAGDAPRAGWLLEEGVRRHPDRDDLRLALARVALLLANPSLAREALAPIAPGSEQHGAALVTRAQAELHLGDLDRALETLADAERRYPDRPEMRLVRIATLLSERRQEEAGAAIEEARAALAREGEEEPEIRRHLDLTLAQIRAARGETEAALAALKDLLHATPTDLLAWRALVNLLVREERAEEALALLEGALATADPIVELLPVSAHVHAALGQDDRAEAALRRFADGAGSAAAYLPLLSFYTSRDELAAGSALLVEALARFPDTPQLLLLHTELLLAEARLDEAVAEFQRFRAATFDEDPQIEYLHARLELAAGDADAAAARLTELAPRLDAAPTHFWLGHALEVMGDSEGARRRYGLARQRDPTWVEPAAALVLLAQRRGDWPAAAAAARVLVQRAPQRLWGWTALVEALVQLEEGDAAAAVAQQSLERFPDRSEPRLLLAKARREQGRYEEALEVLAAAGAQGDAAAERVLTLGMAGRVEEGIALAQELVTADPDAAELHAVLAALFFAAGAAEEGAQATDRALALAPDTPRPLRVRCEFRAATGRWQGARDDCTRYLAARPDDAGAHFMLGVAQAALGQNEQAIASYRRAAALDERDARSRNNLAELLAAAGDLEAALVEAQEAYRLDGQSPYVADTLGALYLRKGLLDRAVSFLEEAHAAAPEMPDPTLHLALAYRGLGRNEEARVLLAGLRESDALSEPLRSQVEEALDSLP